MAGAALQPGAEAGWAAEKHPWGPTSAFLIPRTSPTRASPGREMTPHILGQLEKSPQAPSILWEQGKAEQSPPCSSAALHTFLPQKTPCLLPAFYHLSCEDGAWDAAPKLPTNRRTGRLLAGCLRGSKEISPPLKSCLRQAGSQASQPPGRGDTPGARSALCSQNG